MLTLKDRSLFIDSTDSDATEASERLNIELSAPIVTELEINRLYVGLRSFTCTNLIYNVQASDYLRFIFVYNYESKTSFVQDATVYIKEGQYTGQQFVDQWSYQQVTPGDPLFTTTPNFHNYTIINPQNMQILPSIAYNARTGKMNFEWSTQEVLSFEIPTTELNDPLYSFAPIPEKVFLPINSQTIFLATRLGIYRNTDTLSETPFAGYSGIFIPLTWDITIQGANTKFQLEPITYDFTHVFKEQSIQFIDIRCDQLAGTNYASKANELYPEGVIARVPILAGFNQTQNSYYTEINWCLLSAAYISTLQFSFENPYSSAAIFKTPIQMEIVVHEEIVTVEELAQTSADQQRYQLPLTNSGDRTNDNLDITHASQTMEQQAVNQSTFRAPSNKRSRYPTL